MALENHIESLRKQHARMKEMVREEESHPAADELLLHRLKLKKLSIKDEIERLTQSIKVAA